MIDVVAWLGKSRPTLREVSPMVWKRGRVSRWVDPRHGQRCRKEEREWRSRMMVEERIGGGANAVYQRQSTREEKRRRGRVRTLSDPLDTSDTRERGSASSL